ncbi:hypothetical protein GCM10009111_09190 [Colwellia asteriadis]|uniref:DUF2788 domain-containing protein n=1 Tax=Colwellia asteriadis TaxID=517723 RepID=A0ABN1L519_9GAMM
MVCYVIKIATIIIFIVVSYIAFKKEERSKSFWLSVLTLLFIGLGGTGMIASIMHNFQSN